MCENSNPLTVEEVCFILHSTFYIILADTVVHPLHLSSQSSVSWELQNYTMKPSSLTPLGTFQRSTHPF